MDDFRISFDKLTLSNQYFAGFSRRVPAILYDDEKEKYVLDNSVSGLVGNSVFELVNSLMFEAISLNQRGLIGKVGYDIPNNYSESEFNLI